MIENALLRCVLYLIALVALAVPLGAYMARVYAGEAKLAARVFGPVERLFYRAAGIREGEDMPFPRYAAAVLLFNLFGLVVVYVLQRLQALLPLNPAGLGAVSPEVSWNTAVSFASNTNWQAYAGETTLSHLTQMLGLTVQNFVSAGTGMAVLVALVRGFTRRTADGIGNFWVDLTRSTLYVLLPLSVIVALVLVSQGVVQTFAGSHVAELLDPTTSSDGAGVTRQILALGPAASQIAIKQLGTNGGGFFNANSAHPFENPNALSNFVEMLSLLLVPAALCFTFGAMVKDKRQGYAVFAAMLAIFVPLLVIATAAEQHGNPVLSSLGVDQGASLLQPGGNMEGKEARFGIVDSTLWTTATTAASNGSVNAMHDSFTPLGGLVPMWLMQLGEIVFGGVGSGLYGMLMYAVIAVFIAGLMVGRTPEYLGKKIEAFEMKMASLVILLPAAAVLVGTALASATPAGTASLGNPGAHGFSEILYAFSSGANNNGSAFGGLTVSGTFYATAIGLCMLIGRYGIIVPVLAIAGSLARKKLVPASAGTLPTHTPLFVLLLVGTILLVGALTFVPALALGPIVEHLSLFAR
ncbi:potassium-transporting ATPase subunit KdpA [Polyangium jinanense]|uniref:Potassium-transporting ATPase potassium-binding subunit n=1 Tax=Polyangium jinanense TaxID=2829994 RepID=A0A9X3X634_9BACT|nr:potassium-transporting ATPase subunit KdpA [Polyangium jinanense]MDC3958370.1 potassium-transporting ATPase subunit KdpA [Polyangium jinanense]MDC3983295.1 potassium-transporting ATPase subunit KdpA [Polyangium jinanense]